MEERIINLQRDKQKHLKQVNELLKIPQAHGILSCLGVHPDELEHSLSITVDANLIYTLIGYIEERERELHEELVDFALEVVYQYGYVIGDGVYATGGLSVIESAFSILRRYDMLDKDGHYSIANQPTVNERRCQ